MSVVNNWLQTPIPTWCLLVGMLVACLTGYVAHAVLHAGVSVVVDNHD